MSTPKRYYGIHACFAIVRHRPKSVRRVFVSKRILAGCEELIAWCDEKHVNCKVTDDAELTKVAATEHHEGLVMEASPRPPESLPTLLNNFKQRKSGLIVHLDGVENPHNLGAVMRSCAFFGVDALIISSRELRELPATTCRIAEGAAETLAAAIVSAKTEVAAAFKGIGFSLVATTPHGGESLYRFSWPAKTLVVFGAEGPGLEEETLKAASHRVFIPRVGDEIESLNVATSVAVFLSHSCRAGK